MKTIHAFLAGLALFFTVSTAFAQGIFLEIPLQLNTSGVPGGTTTEVKLTSIDYGIENRTTVGSTPGGAGAARTVFNELLITKQVDVSSIFLQKTLSAGIHFPVIKLNFYRAGASGARELVYQILVKTAFITKYSASGTEGCSGGCPGLSESIAIAYGALVVTDYSRPVPAYSWSVVSNTEDTSADN